MYGRSSGELRHRTSTRLTAVTSFLVLVYIGAESGSAWQTPTATSLPPLGGGMVGGVFLAAATSAAVVSWHRHRGRQAAWIVATGVIIASQSMVVTLVGIESTQPYGPVAQTALVAVGLVGMVVVGRPLLLLRHTPHVLDDGVAIGMGTGLVAAAYLGLQLPLRQPVPTGVDLAIAIVVATHLYAVTLVLRRRALPRPLAWLLAATVVVVDLGALLHASGIDSPALAITASAARAAIGAAWLTVAWETLQACIDDDRRRINTFERALVDNTRGQREQMHELRSTLAGLITGSAMLDRSEVPVEVRERLWRSVRRELARMERLLSSTDEQATDIDLDEAMGMILDLQRLKGRHVEYRSKGGIVRVRFDALAEVINILADNAAVHGGSDRSLVEVAPRDSTSIDITVTDYGRGIPREQRSTIFSWGKRGGSSPGEGIGLSVAERLMREDGGSLRLAEDRGVGSTFVVTLPAARRPLDDTVLGRGR